jgi:disulfide bond formation protein DsbB
MDIGRMLLTAHRGAVNVAFSQRNMSAMNPFHYSYRASFFIGFLICAGLLGFALYAQYVLLMDPCPLCILQRVVFIGLGLVFLAGALQAPRGNGRWAYVILAVLIAAIGIGIAGRHLWIQSLPADQVPSCGAPLGYMLETRAGNGGLMGVLLKVLTGSGECAKVEPILGMPMPFWSLVWYVLLAFWAIRAGVQRRRLRYSL